MSETLNKEITQLILAQIDEYNDVLPTKVDLQQGIDSVLFGDTGVLDSIDFITFVLDIEDAVREKYNISITLSDEKAMSQKRSPFRTIRSLAAYVEQLVGEQNV